MVAGLRALHGELSREEAERVAGYVERDMKDAAGFLGETHQELADWLKFDLRMIESRLLEMFANVADRTRRLRSSRLPTR